MTTRCRWVPERNAFPAAMPTFKAISDVIGCRLASPRIPSVPKYRRDMSFPVVVKQGTGVPLNWTSEKCGQELLATSLQPSKPREAGHILLRSYDHATSKVELTQISDHFPPRCSNTPPSWRIPAGLDRATESAHTSATYVDVERGGVMRAAARGPGSHIEG